MKFLLVEWVEDDPRAYSVVSSRKLVDKTHRLHPDDTLGLTVQIQFSLGKVYPGRVLKIDDNDKILGDEADLLSLKAKQDVESPVQGRSVKRGTKRPQTSAELIGAILSSSQNLECNVGAEVMKDGSESPVTLAATRHSVDHRPPSESDGTSSNEVGGEISEDCVEGSSSAIDYKERYDNLKDKFKSMKGKYKDLKKRSKTDDPEIELYPGSGVTLPSSVLASIRITSSKATILARNLFRRTFTTEELGNFSLFGKICNANKEKVPLPEIDKTRRDAVINYVIKQQGFDGVPATGNPEADKIVLESRQAFRKAIVKSLSEFLREENKKYAEANKI